MTFTKAEVRLCKKIAKLYEKPMFSGDWYINIGREIDIAEYEFNHAKKLGVTIEPFTPLWSWQDCREWLRGKGWRLWGMEEMKAYGRQYEIIIIQFAEINNLDNQTEEHGDTDLEAILKVVLAVLKKEKEI